jgi:hypothetical protein
VEHNAHSGLGDACTALLVHKLLQVCCPHLQEHGATNQMIQDAYNMAGVDE